MPPGTTRVPVASGVPPLMMAMVSASNAIVPPATAWIVPLTLMLLGPGVAGPAIRVTFPPVEMTAPAGIASASGAIVMLLAPAEPAFVTIDAFPVAVMGARMVKAPVSTSEKLPPAENVDVAAMTLVGCVRLTEPAALPASPSVTREPAVWAIAPAELRMIPGADTGPASVRPPTVVVSVMPEPVVSGPVTSRAWPFVSWNTSLAEKLARVPIRLALPVRVTSDPELPLSVPATIEPPDWVTLASALSVSDVVAPMLPAFR